MAYTKKANVTMAPAALMAIITQTSGDVRSRSLAPRAKPPMAPIEA